MGFPISNAFRQVGPAFMGFFFGLCNYSCHDDRDGPCAVGQEHLDRPAGFAPYPNEAMRMDSAVALISWSGLLGG